jgi:hypothetical protein
MSKRIQTMALMLGSDQPGEVASAANMLLKELKKDGKDIHWLAAQLSGTGGGSSYSNGSSNYGGRSAQAWATECIQYKNHLEQERAGRRRDADEIIRLKRELLLAKQGANQSAGSAYAQQQANAYAQANAYSQAGQNRWYEPDYAEQVRQAYKGFGSQAATPPQPGEAWFVIARWCLNYGATGGRTLLKQNEEEFLDSLLTRHGGRTDFALSYRQQTWLDDIFDRLRRVHSARGM